MHDPSLLVFDVRLVRLDVWHDEPGGRDSGEVCGHAPMRLGPRAAWTVRHARHLHFRFWPYLNIRRWIRDHCDECGRRFLWKDARHSYQGTDKVWHGQCMDLRHVRSQLAELTAYAQGDEMDSNARWRVEYRLKGLKEMAHDEV